MILATGGAGFVGSNPIEELEERGIGRHVRDFPARGDPCL